MKKGQAMSLNTIVIAALVVLVLVILSVIFMGRMGWWSGATNECQGTCQDDRCEEGYTKISGTCYGSNGEKDEYKVCCSKLNI